MCWQDVQIARATNTKNVWDSAENGTRANAVPPDPQRVGITLLTGDAGRVVFVGGFGSLAGVAVEEVSVDLTQGEGRSLTLYQVGNLITQGFYLVSAGAAEATVMTHTLDTVGPSGQGVAKNWPGS